MALRIEIRVQRLPEGVRLATGRDLPGLTVEADTREEAQRIAPEVARDLIEEERGSALLEWPAFTFTSD